jgi:hypothetical protein
MLTQKRFESKLVLVFSYYTSNNAEVSLFVT